jgi:Gas vesicle synthesis protein GvpL/GvpF.
MNSGEGRYLYGVITSNQRQEFGPIGIGARGDTVYTLPYRDLTAIISHSPIEKYAVSRENLLAHSKTLEKVAEAYTVLPVRFSTIAADESAIVDKLLKSRYQELTDLLKSMEGKLELGIRARWENSEAIFAELVEENKEIKELKAATLKEKNQQKRYANQIKIGELVQNALEEKRRRERIVLIDAIKPLSLDYKEMQIYGDMNIVSVAFLVNREQEASFDQKIGELRQAYEPRTQLKYTISAVAYNFVELVVTW